MYLGRPPVIPQVFGTSVSDKSPGSRPTSRPFLSPAIFSRHLERASAFVDAVRSPSFILVPLSPIPFLSLSLSLRFIPRISTHRSVAESTERETTRRGQSIRERCSVVTQHARLNDADVDDGNRERNICCCWTRCVDTREDYSRRSRGTVLSRSVMVPRSYRRAKRA